MSLANTANSVANTTIDRTSRRRFFRQALHFTESLARGEPNRKKIALTTISDQVRELI
jgi:hypothetical protein